MKEEGIQVDSVERVCRDTAYNLASSAFPRYNYGIVTDRLAGELRRELPEFILRLAAECLQREKQFNDALAINQGRENNGQDF